MTGLTGLDGPCTRRNFLRVAAAGVGVAVVGSGCANSSPGGAGSSATASGTASHGGAGGNVAISLATGISYAPLIIIRAKGWLEKDLPGRSVTWTVINGGAVTRDGLLSGTLQAGATGVGPYLIGWDRGVPWKIICSLNDMPLWLMVKNPRLKSLKDFTSTDRIAAVSPGSIESVVLEKGALQQLGNAHALDSNIASLPHPEALQSLIDGQVAGDLTSPPFEFEEEAMGARKILDSYKLFGQHTFNMLVALESYAKENADVIDAIYKNVARANQYIVQHPDEAAKMLSAAAKHKISAANYQSYITHPGIVWTTVPNGLERFAAFMKSINVITKAPSSWKDLVFHTLANSNGS